MKTDNILLEKSMSFAIRIVKLCRFLKRKNIEAALIGQVIRSGTSIGANVHEARSAQSKADFISKLSIALKEADETGFWLELLRRTDSLTDAEFNSMEHDRGELFALLTSILKTLKSRGC